tara:strand:- start:2233 stop:2667 length:435 start_codon:yes stop_codon:yes gene_type:complete
MRHFNKTMKETIMKNRNLISTLAVFFMPIVLWGQSVAGTVTDAETSKPLVGANVVVEGTDLGAAADADGAYSIKVDAGSYTLTASSIGYASLSVEVDVAEGKAVSAVDFSLSVSALEMSALEVLASRADEKTPVAYTTVGKEET